MHPHLVTHIRRHIKGVRRPINRAPTKIARPCAAFRSPRTPSRPAAVARVCPKRIITGVSRRPPTHRRLCCRRVATHAQGPRRPGQTAARQTSGICIQPGIVIVLNPTAVNPNPVNLIRPGYTVSKTVRQVINKPVILRAAAPIRNSLLMRHIRLRRPHISTIGIHMHPDRSAVTVRITGPASQTAANRRVMMSYGRASPSPRRRRRIPSSPRRRRWLRT